MPAPRERIPRVNGKSRRTVSQALPSHGQLLAILADPTRRALLERLYQGPQPVVELARGLPVSRPAVSQHLKALKAAHLVSDRREANRRIYSLQPAGLGPLISYLERFWGTALESYSEAATRRARLGQDVAVASVIPTIRRSVTVPLEPARAFELFTTGIGEWWPIESKFARGPVQSLVFEGRPDGRVYEIDVDGVIVDYARVRVWEPPDRVVVAWFVQPELGPPTEVEVRFTKEGAGCRVDLEHRGFENYGDEVGRKQRDSYAGGWPGVLDLFAARAAREQPRAL